MGLRGEGFPEWLGIGGTLWSDLQAKSRIGGILWPNFGASTGTGVMLSSGIRPCLI
ncbi:rCG44318 [Rattus norvegicus]|uniref:RCG44318 n=1 Tax=Rattus norvegicus TaxID=10116 RepID=A6KD88_RAT|nr:rCG44318 [Rattus norvegicus]